jgi:hypothetical protein
MQKFIGAKFFDWDLMMYNVVTDEPAKARTSDLNEELGQVGSVPCLSCASVWSWSESIA